MKLKEMLDSVREDERENMRLESPEEVGNTVLSRVIKHRGDISIIAEYYPINSGGIDPKTEKEIRDIIQELNESLTYPSRASCSRMIIPNLFGGKQIMVLQIEEAYNRKAHKDYDKQMSKIVDCFERTKNLMYGYTQ